jgi:hypothetical protein
MRLHHVLLLGSMLEDTVEDMEMVLEDMEILLEDMEILLEDMGINPSNNFTINNLQCNTNTNTNHNTHSHNNTTRLKWPHNTQTLSTELLRHRLNHLNRGHQECQFNTPGKVVQEPVVLDLPNAQVAVVLEVIPVHRGQVILGQVILEQVFLVPILIITHHPFNQINRLTTINNKAPQIIKISNKCRLPEIPANNHQISNSNRVTKVKNKNLNDLQFFVGAAVRKIPSFPVPKAAVSLSKLFQLHNSLPPSQQQPRQLHQT